ncbi:MAG: VanZ family protein [Chloroflexota bacterium]
MHSINRIALQPPILRRLYAVLWVAVVTVTLLQSSEHPLIGPGQPPGPVSLERDILLTAAHAIAFSGLLTLLWWALHPARRALSVSLIFCWCYGVATELLQTLQVDRGASLSDLLMDFAASGAAALVIARRGRSQAGSYHEEAEGRS